MSKGTLVITNGDSAVDAIRASGVPVDHVLPWRDVLFEGPVPGHLSPDALRDVRVRYLSEASAGKRQEIDADLAARDAVVAAPDLFKEIILWFEHDLYDQLQLVQILARLKEHAPRSAAITMICRNTFVTDHTEAELREQYNLRKPVPPEAFLEASEAWRHFTSAEPSGMADFALLSRSDALPFLRKSLWRLINEYPDARCGVSRTEWFVLNLLGRHGAKTGSRLFRAFNVSEDAAFMGDWSFFQILQDLSDGHALVKTDGDIDNAAHAHPLDRCATATFRITSLGNDVLNGRHNAIAIRGIDRWIGGVHLTTDAVWFRSPDSWSPASVWRSHVIGPVDMSESRLSLNFV